MAKQYGIIAVINSFISCAVAMIIATKGYGYWALAFQTVILFLVSSFLTIFICPWKPTFSFDFSPLKQLFSFSFKLLITSIFSIININIFAVILGKFYSMTDVGNYNQGQKWAAMGCSFINGMFSYVTQPVLVEAGDEKVRQVNILRKLIRCGAFISFPLMLGLAFVGKEFIIIAIGEKWLPAVPFLQLFCLWNSVSFLSTLFTNLIYTQGKSDLYMKITIFIGLLQLAGIAAMYPFGILPMVIGYLAVSFLSLFIWHHYVKKLVGLQLRKVLKDTLPYLGITLLCFGIVWLITLNIQNLYLLIILKIVISGILYIFAMKASNSVMFKESMEFLMSRIKK
jgi:O-antigen/teichoic acid export membrane protein